jgi:G patch domain-containing protein 1
LAKVVQDLAAALSQYAPPSIPEGWVSSKGESASADSSNYTSAADAAKASTLDPRSRAALLGEKALPGKSVFDFISSASRDRLAVASGNKSLPPGLGEFPEGHVSLTEDEKRKALWDQASKLDQSTAAAALSRSSAGPYADDEAKRGRYRKYLMSQANPGQDPPQKATGATDQDYIREMNEFYNCARIFKPMTGFMASRFTTSKTVLNPSSSNSSSGSDSKTNADLLSRPEPKSSDPAEEAAKMGMFGHMTRSVEDFYPTRLLCKRFNVRAPAHVRPDYEAERAPPASNAGDGFKVPVQWPSTVSITPDVAPPAVTAQIEAPSSSRTQKAMEPSSEVNPEENEAVEGKVANADVLKAIFGDSDSE